MHVHELCVIVPASGHPVWQASPGECQKLEHQQVALQKVSPFTLWVKGHRLCGVQDFCHLPTTVHNVRKASGVEVGQ